jgi:hypothetical protein
MSEPASYKRPPVPSAEESSRAGWMAPLVAVALSMFVVKSSPDPMVKLVVGGICCLIILFGLVASIWGFYVASFYGPRKHIVPAVIGFTLNACWIGLLVVAVQAAREAKVAHDRGTRAVPDVAEIQDDTPDRY